MTNNRKHFPLLKHCRLLGGLVLLVVLLCISFGVVQSPPDKPVVDFTQKELLPAYQAMPQEKALKMALVSVLDRQETYRYQQQLVAAIANKMGETPVMMQRASYAEIMQLLDSGVADAALISTGAYGVYGHKKGYVPLVMQQRNQSSFYTGLIIVPANSFANSLEDLQGKSFAWTDPLSYSGHLGVIRQLRALGKDADTFFSTTQFTSSHDKSLRAVAGGFFDGASIDTLVYDYYEKKHADLLKKVRIIARLPAAGTGPIVVRPDYEKKEKLRQVLLHLHEDPEASAALSGLLIERFVPARKDDYPSL